MTMQVWLYALCWNDAAMLPSFFRHYDPVVTRYTIYDDGSTDGSLEMLASHPRVEVRRFERAHPDSFVQSEGALSDQMWKGARGRAEWVIVCDIDEHLTHRDLGSYLAMARAGGVTAVPSLGFQMLSEEAPTPGAHLAAAVHRGAPWADMDKLSIFDPEAIEEINFLPGRHAARPVGTVVVPEVDEVLNLHFKYLGRARTLQRHGEQLTGLGRRDKAEGWGVQYTWDDAALRDHWEQMLARSVDLAYVDPLRVGHVPWWREPGRDIALT